MIATPAKSLEAAAAIARQRLRAGGPGRPDRGRGAGDREGARRAGPLPDGPDRPPGAAVAGRSCRAARPQ
ncbi:hypothetical protein ACRAWD_30490 [Caulobacter segnis]